MYDSSFFYENLKVPTVAMGERLCRGVTAGAEGRPGGSLGMGLKGEPRGTEAEGGAPGAQQHGPLPCQP